MNTTNHSKKPNPKQIAALIGIILLIGLYVVTLFVAIFSPADGGKLFAACLYSTVGVPILLWLFIWGYGKYTGKRTIASPPEILPEDALTESTPDSSQEV